MNEMTIAGIALFLVLVGYFAYTTYLNEPQMPGRRGGMMPNIGKLMEEYEGNEEVTVLLLEFQTAMESRDMEKVFEIRTELENLGVNISMGSGQVRSGNMNFRGMPGNGSFDGMPGNSSFKGW